MVKCDEFHEKWQKIGNFCDKAPKTATKINVYLDKILPRIEKEASEIQILEAEKATIGDILSEEASRPLFSGKDQKVREEAIQQIVKLSKEKAIDGKKPQVTGREVKGIVKAIRSEMPSACGMNQPSELLKTSATTTELIDYQEEATGTATEKVEAISLKYIPVSETVSKAIDLQAFRSFLEALKCPDCGKAGIENIIWKCCGKSVEGSLKIAEKGTHDHADAEGLKREREAPEGDILPEVSGNSSIDLDVSNGVGINALLPLGQNPIEEMMAESDNGDQGKESSGNCGNLDDQLALTEPVDDKPKGVERARAEENGDQDLAKPTEMPEDHSGDKETNSPDAEIAKPEQASGGTGKEFEPPGPGNSTSDIDAFEDLCKQVEGAIAEFNAKGIYITPGLIARQLGTPGRTREVRAALRRLGYRVTEKRDPDSHVPIWEHV